MKNFKSVEEGIWVSETNEISETEIQCLTDIYNSNKSSVMEDLDTHTVHAYQLVQADIALEGDILVKGLVNCRIDDEHTQIRF